MQSEGGFPDAAEADQTGGGGLRQTAQQHLVDSRNSYRNLGITDDVRLACGSESSLDAWEKLHAFSGNAEGMAAAQKAAAAELAHNQAALGAEFKQLVFQLEDTVHHGVLGTHLAQQPAG